MQDMLKAQNEIGCPLKHHISEVTRKLRSQSLVWEDYNTTIKAYEIG
jgi:hypothetical protein